MIGSGFIVAIVALYFGSTPLLEERIDLFAPLSGAYLGTERTSYSRDGRRLRLEISGADGKPDLLFFVMHDETGRESEAIYFQEPGGEHVKEQFAYSEDGLVRTTTYFYVPGVAADRTEVELDAEGRELRKHYYRPNGDLYGIEDVFWNGDGTKLGWDFRYTNREGGASFRYSYDGPVQEGEWTLRIRSRDGKPERIEARTRFSAAHHRPYLTPARFAPGTVSTAQSETSPSFTSDGKTMVFARYAEDWAKKTPFIAYLEETGWRVEPVPGIGAVYNLAISPAGDSIVYAKRSGDITELLQLRREDDGWSAPVNLTSRFGLAGTYPCVTGSGDLIFYNADGNDGDGIYGSRSDGEGYGAAAALYLPPAGTAFDAYGSHVDGPLLLTRCIDETCEPGPVNGAWQLAPATSGEADRAARKMPALGYVWGIQPVPALGILIFTDGEDILAIPLAAAGLEQALNGR